MADLPHVVNGAQRLVEAAGLDPRCECVEIDMFEIVPEGADCYTLASVIHDWGDQQAAQILRNCRNVMIRGGKILIIEPILPPPNEPHAALLDDIEMLVMTGGGCERTREEFQALLAEAGLRISEIIPTKSYWSIIEATV